MSKWYAIILFAGSLFSSEFYYEFGKKVYVEPINKIRDLRQNDNIKRYKIGSKIVNFKNEIVVKLKKSIDAQDFFQKYGVSDFRKIAKDIYIVTLSKGDDLIKLSKTMYEDQDTIYAIPNKIKKYQKR